MNDCWLVSADLEGLSSRGAFSLGRVLLGGFNTLGSLQALGTVEKSSAKLCNWAPGA